MISSCGHWTWTIARSWSMLKNSPSASFAPSGPLAAHALLVAAAVNRVHHDAVLDGLLAGRVIIDRALGEGLVAGDENRLVAVGFLRPVEPLDRLVDDLAAVFVAAAGPQAQTAPRTACPDRRSAARPDECSLRWPAGGVLPYSNKATRNCGVWPFFCALANCCTMVQSWLLACEINPSIELDVSSRMATSTLGRCPLKGDLPSTASGFFSTVMVTRASSARATEVKRGGQQYCERSFAWAQHGDRPPVGQNGFEVSLRRIGRDPGEKSSRAFRQQDGIGKSTSKPGVP